MHYLEAERRSPMISADVFIEERCKLNQLLVAELNVRQGICIQEGSQVRVSGVDRVVPRLVKPRYAVKADAIVGPNDGHQAMSLPVHNGTIAALSLALFLAVVCHSFLSLPATTACLVPVWFLSGSR